ELWDRYRTWLCVVDSVGLSLDISRMSFAEDFLPRMKAPIEKALDSMAALEAGAIANPDENRMVGHYWLRAPELAPTSEIRHAIEQTLSRIESFAAGVHEAQVRPETRPRFRNLLVIGIGGSALGPQFVSNALGSSADRMQPFFIDNTDP